MKSSLLLTSLGMLVAFSGLSSLAYAHEHDRDGDARQRSVHHRSNSMQESAYGGVGGMLAVPATAAPGEPGYAWQYFSDSTAGTAVVISPHGEYFFSRGDGLRLVAVTRTVSSLSLPAATAQAEPVMDSFERMFHHEPTYTYSAAPSDVDPLVTALVALLGDVHAKPVRLA